jgi:hypothetical protein
LSHRKSCCPIRIPNHQPSDISSNPSSIMISLETRLNSCEVIITKP